MRYKSVGEHLRPYLILARRRTTINHAFASAIAPSDVYDDERVRAAMIYLGQDPDSELLCSYCQKPAETWDHVFATVEKSLFSGHGHRLGNLLPCCKPCNSKKGSKNWRQYLASVGLPNEELNRRTALIAAYIDVYGVRDDPPVHSSEYMQLQAIREEVLGLLAKADQLAANIRGQSTLNHVNPNGKV